MSKKATRRAAREAFPKAKNPPPKRSAYGARPARSRPSSRRGRSAYSPGVPKPPTVKRAAILGGLMAVIYFVFIQWLWKSGGTTWGNLIVAAGSFIIFSAVIYAVDRFKYQRYLRKKGQSK